MMEVTSLYGLRVVAFSGEAKLRLVGREDGLVYDVALRDGWQDMTNYQPLLAAFKAEFHNCIVNNVAIGERRIVDQRGEDFGATAAVPTYQPSEAVIFERMVSDIARKIADEAAAKERKRAEKAERFAKVRDKEPDVGQLEPVVPGPDPVDPVLVKPSDAAEATPDAAPAQGENPQGEKPKGKGKGVTDEAV